MYNRRKGRNRGGKDDRLEQSYLAWDCSPSGRKRKGLTARVHSQLAKAKNQGTVARRMANKTKVMNTLWKHDSTRGCRRTSKKWSKFLTDLQDMREARASVYKGRGGDGDSGTPIKNLQAPCARKNDGRPKKGKEVGGGAARRRIEVPIRMRRRAGKRPRRGPDLMY